MKQKVVIIGHGYLSRLSLIRSLGQAGYDVTVIVTMYGLLNTQRPLDCYSRYVGEVYYCHARDERGLIAILLDHCTDQSQKVVIIPDSDYSAAFVDKNRELLSEHFMFPHVRMNKADVSDMMDKEWQKQLSRRVGLNTPATTTVRVRKGVMPETGNINYPCFTKALTTMQGGKQWFRRCDDRTQLLKAVNDFAKGNDANILVEDYIDIEKEYAVVGVSDGKDVYIPGVIQITENCKCHLGIARKGRILPVKGFESLIGSFKKYVEETAFIGLFDIDFLYSKGNYYFCEMNFRYGGSGYAYTKSGINLPALFVEMIVGNRILAEEKKEIADEKSYVNERMLLDDLKTRNIDIRYFNQSLRTADIRFIPDEIDKKPKRIFNRIVLRVKIKYLLKKILQRK